MKTKKILFTVLTIALVTAFIIGCITPLEESTKSDTKGKVQSAPGEKTKVRLNIGEVKGRTLTPAVSSLGLSDFDGFKLEVYDIANNCPVTIDPADTPFDDVFSYSDLLSGDGLEVHLVPDMEYIFTILAYIGSETNPAAWGTDRQTIDEVSNDTINIVLHEIFLDVGDYTYTGKFTWALTLGTGETISVFTLVPFSGVGTTHTLATNTTGTESGIKPGKYIMTLGIQKTDYQTEYVRELVYIYSGFTTDTSAIVSLPTLRKNTFQVTLNYGDDAQGAGETRPSGTKVVFGNVISTAVAALFPSDQVTVPGEPDAVGSGIIFKNWKVTNSAGANLGDLKMTDDITLWAMWGPFYKMLTGIDLSVSWSSNSASTPADFSGSSGSYNAVSGIKILDLVLTADVTDASSYRWYYGSDGTGTPFAYGDTPDPADTKFSMNTLTGYEVQERWFTVGTHYITLVTDVGNWTYSFTNP